MRQYVVDAFTDRIFAGNPAAVCILEQWPREKLLLNITRENNLSETAFAVKTGDRYHLRWFTPGGEIDLCGHATLATAYVITRFYELERAEIVFDTLSGPLTVTKKGELFEMDFPAYSLRQVPVTQEMTQAMGVRPLEAWMGRDLLCVLESEEQVRTLQPDQEKVRALDGLLLQVTARGSGEFACVSRTFAPKCNVPEDPVCGSGHCHIVPYWAGKLGISTLTACQASPRGGILYGEMAGNRVKLGGKAALYSVSELYVE